MYDLLVKVSSWRPVEGNKDGSLLTFHSRQAGLFGLVCFGVGWAPSVDSQLFQKAIACDMGKPGRRFSNILLYYSLGTLCWFAIPFVLATTLGLAWAELEESKYFPRNSHYMSKDEIKAGLVMTYGAYALLGRSSVVMIFTMIFMAVTASFSSETMAVSSLLTHDAYKPTLIKKPK